MRCSLFRVWSGVITSPALLSLFPMTASVRLPIEIEAGFEGWVKAFLIPVGSELTDFQAILEITSDQP